jgi:GNAT superfamily N-acetyltransferase
MTVRAAVTADVTAIAEVHVRAWQIGYRGQIHDSYLDALDPRRSAATIRTIVESEADEQQVFVCERDGRGVIGFAYVEARDGCDIGEVNSLYVDPDSWRLGVGSELLDAATAYLEQRRFLRAALWVLDTNDRARRFYEALGWSHDGGTQALELGDETLTELRYARELPAPRHS